MADSLILQWRVLALLDEIEQARVAMELFHGFAPALHAGVSPRFGRTLTAEERRVRPLAAGPIADADIAAGWKLLRQARAATSPVMREIHTLVQGAMARRDGLDRGILRLADALLDELGEASEYKARMTVLADREFYGELAEMIRLRFPDTNVWVLPVVAHEFLHFLVRSLRVQAAGSYTYPLQDLLQRADDPMDRQRLEELVGDMFATYVLGPAYALTCVMLRFDVGELTAQDPSHPSPSVRVEAIIRTLQDAPASSYGHPYEPLISLVKARWLALRGTADVASRPNEQADLMLLDTHAKAVLRTFQETLPQARYETFREAQDLAPTIRHVALLGYGPGPAITATIPDILNALWLVRLEAGEQADGFRHLESYGISLIEQQIANRQAGVVAGAGRPT